MKPLEFLAEQLQNQIESTTPYTINQKEARPTELKITASWDQLMLTIFLSTNPLDIPWSLKIKNEKINNEYSVNPKLLASEDSLIQIAFKVAEDIHQSLRCAK